MRARLCRPRVLGLAGRATLRGVLDLGLDARATLQAASARIGRARHFAGRVLDLGLDARATLQAASARIGRARHFAGRVLDLGLPGARLCGPSVGSRIAGRATLRAARIGRARDSAGRKC
jgi:hypothetical protein